MIKVFFLIFEPSVAWEKIAQARRGFLYITVTHLLPFILLGAALEAWGLGRHGKWQPQFQMFKAYSPQEICAYEIIQSLLLLAVVLSVSTLAVTRLHKVFASQDLNANSGAGIKIVQFNPKVVKYDILGPPGSTANINYWDADANTHQINNAPLPWSFTISTTLPAVSANIMAQTDADYIGCRITVDGELREHQSSDGHNAQTFCLVKSA